MTDTDNDAIANWLAQASVDRSIFELCPDYCAGLMVMADTTSGPSGPESDALLELAERSVLEETDAAATAEAQVEAWRETYRAFGAKPKRTRPSVDALRRRSGAGLPRINRVTDLYNAISVIHGVPIGVEDVASYDGPLRLVRAIGDEPFLTTKDGEPVTETVEAGEPIWRDDLGVTCRRWNWRQTPRTALGVDTRVAVFIVDALGTDAPMLAATVLDHLERAIGAGGASPRRFITMADAV